LVLGAIESASPSEAPSKSGFLFAITGNVMEDKNRDNVVDVDLGNNVGAILGCRSWNLPTMDKSSREHALNEEI
jgi:hypothetical protein